MTKSFMRSLFVGLAVSGCAVAVAEPNDVTPPVRPKAWEKCYGISRAGMNHCSSLKGGHGCGGYSKVDGDPDEYIWVPLNYCAKIVNGQLGVEPAKKVKVKKCLQYARGKSPGGSPP